jgi:hypothetical protein
MLVVEKRIAKDVRGLVEELLLQVLTTRLLDVVELLLREMLWLLQLQAPESADIHDTPTYESSSEDEQTDTDTTTAQTQEESPLSMTRPSRVRQTV